MVKVRVLNPAIAMSTLLLEPKKERHLGMMLTTLPFIVLTGWGKCGLVTTYPLGASKALQGYLFTRLYIINNYKLKIMITNWTFTFSIHLLLARLNFILLKWPSRDMSLSVTGCLAASHTSDKAECRWLTRSSLLAFNVLSLITKVYTWVTIEFNSCYILLTARQIAWNNRGKKGGRHIIQAKQGSGQWPIAKWKMPTCYCEPTCHLTLCLCLNIYIRIGQPYLVKILFCLPVVSIVTDTSLVEWNRTKMRQTLP